MRMPIEQNKTKIYAALVTSLFLLASACSQGNQERTATPSNAAPTASTANASPTASSENSKNMSIARSGSQPSSQGPAENFTGSVRVDPLIKVNEPSRVSAGRVTFEAGARSNWHTHPLGQNLIVTSGTGWVQQEGGRVEEMREGDVIWTPPGVKHWHGATATTAVTHIAVTEQLDGKNVNWLEKVTDEQYRAGSDAR